MREVVFTIGLLLVLAGMAMAHHGGSHEMPEVTQLAQLYYVPGGIPQVVPQYYYYYPSYGYGGYGYHHDCYRGGHLNYWERRALARDIANEVQWNNMIGW